MIRRSGFRSWLARGWNSFLGAIRSELTVSARLRELAICAVAVLNEAPYELLHHAPVWLAEGGTQLQLDALAEPDLALKREDLFDAAERATLRLSIEMTRRVKVDDAVFRDLQNALDNERETIEMVAVIAAYNMVSRVIVALGIDPE